jgi:hypothetical protein
MSNVKRKCKVVMLSTNEKALLYTEPKDYKMGSYLKYADPRPPYFNNKHLYFLSDEEIKEGDWLINERNQVEKCDNNLHNLLRDTGKYEPIEGQRKIIATTNIEMVEEKDWLPQPSQSFIEKYIEKYNKGQQIDEVLIEYESYCTYGDSCPSKGAYYKQHLCNIDYKLKVNPKDNTITIKPVKESWSREEVFKLLHEAHDIVVENCNYKNYLTATAKYTDFDKLIEENL